MSATIEILTATGGKLIEFGAGEFKLGTRSYCLREIGDADFDVPRNNPKVQQQYLSAPNLVRIQSSTGIPAWYGRIAKVRWSSPEFVNIVCKSGESLLQRQALIVTSSDSSFVATMSTGAYLRKALQAAIAHGLTGIAIGTIDNSGPTAEFTNRADDLWDTVIPDLITKSYAGLEDPDEDAGYCFWVDQAGEAHWQPRRGRDRRQAFTLHVGAGGVGYSTPVFEINYDEIVTYAYGIGNAIYWKDKTKETFQSSSLVARWGVHDAIVDVDSNTSTACLKAAKSAMATQKRTLDVTIDNESAAWLKFWVGDVIRVQDPRSGWPEDGGMSYDCRITGVEVQEEAERMRVIGQEWTLD